MNNPTKIAIIGAGAAGMMAAVTILERFRAEEIELHLIEKNAVLGRKVMISGGGRCNVTTGVTELSEVLTKYPRGAKFLRTAMYDFPPAAMYDWVEERGVPLKVEKDLRVFPKSNQGRDIVNIFEKTLLADSRVKVHFRTSVLSVSKHGQQFQLTLGGDTLEEINTDFLIITTGGQAYRHTGSSGEGYAFAEALGHTITPLAPSLSSFICSEQWPKNLAGVSFPHVRLRLNKSDRHEFSGPIIFTHKGISGPAVFALSALAAYETVTATSPADLFLDFFPEKNYELLSNELEQAIKAHPQKSFQHLLGGFIVRSVAQNFCEQIEISSTKSASEISKKDFNRILELLKNSKITLHERTPGDEFVTAGGVSLAEVDNKTMQSKVCQNLFFAGEILDMDGFTGGYNLQASWATGRKAGISVLSI